MSKETGSTEFNFLKLTSSQLLGLTAFTALGYILYSLISDGLYQHDEAAHFINMRSFWFDPSVILSNWAKPGYKILTAPFALLGPFALVIFNSIIASSSCFVGYKLMERLGFKAPILAFILLMIQPFWLQLSFRNYSESISALILISAIWAHYGNKYWLAALLLSFTATIRQEMYPIIAVYGVYFLSKVKIKEALLLAVFPLVHNIFGWIDSGDPLYLINSVLGFSSNIQDAYPRQGFDHYFKMALTVFGGAGMTYFFAYLGQGIFQKKKIHWFILIPALLYFFMHAFFSIQSFKIGPSTGGNLRYLIVIAPLLAVLGGIAIERLATFQSMQEKRVSLITMSIFAVIVLVFLSYQNNNIVFTDQKDYLPFITVLLSILIVLPKFTLQRLTLAVTGVVIFSGFLTVKPFPKNPEDELVFNFVEWAQKNNIEEHPLLLNHTMLYYYMGKVQQEFELGAAPINQETVDSAKVGTYIIWDSHYSYRPNLRKNSLSHTYFLERPEEFRMVINPMLTPNQRFGIFMFEKIK